MEFITLGNANCIVSRTAFDVSCFIQEDLKVLADLSDVFYEGGTNFFICDEENELGLKTLSYCFHEKRRDVHYGISLCEKNPVVLESKIEQKLELINSDYLDLVALEKLSFVPSKGSSDALFDVLLQMQRKEKIKAIGFKTDNFDLAKTAVLYKNYDVLLYPFDINSDINKISELIKLCEENECTFVATNVLNEKLSTNIPVICGFYSQFEDIIPVWNSKKVDTIKQILYFSETPPQIDAQFEADLQKLKML
ncbi:MAG: hypothetical protein GX220_01605 [Treponema sp.]|nr:hypothetical protein [Treponema sp.]